MILDTMNIDGPNQPRTPSDRILDGLELLKEYDLDIPVEIIDASEEDGTDTGRKCLALLQQIADIEAKVVDISIKRLESYREGIGAPPLTTQQHALAGLFFHNHIDLSLVEASMELFQGFLATFTPDAAADLKKAMLMGLYDEEEC